MTKELETILAACRTICEHPYDNDVDLDTTYNGHRIYKYERSLAAVVIDHQVVNMGVINERYPNGSCTFNVHQVDMTGLQYIRYKLTGLLPMMVTCPNCGAKFSVFPDDVDLDEFGYLTWCDDCDTSFDVDIPQEWADFLGTDEPGAALPEPEEHKPAEPNQYLAAITADYGPEDGVQTTYQIMTAAEIFRRIDMYDCYDEELDLYLLKGTSTIPCTWHGAWHDMSDPLRFEIIDNTTGEVLDTGYGTDH